MMAICLRFVSSFVWRRSLLVGLKREQHRAMNEVYLISLDECYFIQAILRQPHTGCIKQRPCTCKNAPRRLWRGEKERQDEERNEMRREGVMRTDDVSVSVLK